MVSLKLFWGTFTFTVGPVLKEHSTGYKNVASEDRYM